MLMFHRSIWAAALLAGCAPTTVAPLPMPTTLAPASLEEAERWAASTFPAGHRDLRFRWSFEDQDGATMSGRGRARIATPDSIRFDVVGPLGGGRASAFVVADSGHWAEPAEEVRKLVPNYPLFWAMLGAAMPPAAVNGARRYADSTLAAWQFALEQDTLEYIQLLSGPRKFLLEVRRQGRTLGRVETRLRPDGLPASSRLYVLSPPSRLDLTFTEHALAAPFAPDTWNRPAVPGR
jgi:hypothetical protein